MLLPTSVSMTQSFKKSLCRFNIQEIDGCIDIEELFQVKITIPESQSKVSEYETMILPKRTSIDIGQCRLVVDQSEFSASGLFGLVNAKHRLKVRAEAKGLELKHSSETLACIPALDVDLASSDKGLEIGYSADFLYLAACKSLADFISRCIPVRTLILRIPSEPSTPVSVGPWTQTFHISSVKLALFDEEGKHELLQGEILDLRLVLNMRDILNVSITCTSAEVNSIDRSVKVLSVEQPDVLIQPRHVDFSCTKTVAHWVRALHELCYPPILSIVRSFTTRHRRNWRTNSPAKDVNLDFANVSVTLTFAPEEGLRAEVARFQTDILRSEKLLRLCFSRSNLYAKEETEKLILTCQDLTVDKKYIEKEGEIVAKIDVTGTGTDLLVPARFPWGRAIFKSVISIVGGIKWTMSFLFPGVVRKPHIVFMEKAVTDLTLTDVRVLIMDDEMNTMIRRKLLVNPENDIYPQLKSIPMNPMFVLTFQTTHGFFGTVHTDNTRLCSTADALTALQDLDYFEIPPESYFAFIMANDLHMVFNNAACEFRDYPWKLYRIKTLTLKGRSMINKNRLPLHNWARWKIHSKVNIGLEGVQFTMGLCLRSAFFDVNLTQLLDVIKRMIIRRGDPQFSGDKTPRLCLVDRLRYVFNGSTHTKISDLTVHLMDSESPLRPATLELHIDSLTADQSPQVLESTLVGLVLQGVGNRPLCVIPRLTSVVSHLFLCGNPNPWILDTDFETHDAMAGFRFYDTEVACKTEIQEVDGNVMEVTYDSSVSAELLKLLIFHIKPPAILMQKQKRKKFKIWSVLKQVKVEKVTLQSPRVILLTRDGTGLQMTIDKVSGSTNLVRTEAGGLLPFEITDSFAVCTYLHLCAFDGVTLSPIYPHEFEEYQTQARDFAFSADSTMMTCLSIQLTQNDVANGELYLRHLSVAGLRLLWTKRLEAVLWQLLTIDPTQIFLRLVKKKKVVSDPSYVTENEFTTIDAPNFDQEAVKEDTGKFMNTAISFYMEVLMPQFNLQNENTLTQMLMLANVAKCKVSVSSLLWDKVGIDSKTEIQVEVESLETFVAPGMVDLRRPVCWLETAQVLTPSLSDSESYEGILRRVFTSRNMSCIVTHFRLPYNYFNFATNLPQRDKHQWLNERRINEVKISLPEVQASMESEHLWTLIDVIQGVLFQIEGSRKAETVSELLKYDEIRKYGREDIRKYLCDRIDKEQWFKFPRVIKSISISMDSVAFRMTKNHEVMLAVDISKVGMEVTISHDGSSTKAFSVHQISVQHDRTAVLRPITADGEEFHASNMMVTLRSSERYAGGKNQAPWHVYEHLELYLYPLAVEITPALYKDIYSFVFPPQEEMDDEQKEAVLMTARGGPKRSHSRKELLKPLSKRKRLPHLFHYCHINEIKTALSIGGWMGLNNTKITIKPFTRHMTFSTAQELWDKYIKFAGKCVVAQVPSVILQGLGREKKDFLPSKETGNKGILGMFKKKKKEGEDDKNHKLMFGSY